MQLLTRYSIFRNVPCSTTNILTVEADRTSVALNIPGVSRTIDLDILNAFKLSFILFMVRCFFLLIHFLVVEEYELSRSARHILSVALTLECVRVLRWSISFSSTLTVSLVMFCVRLLSELMHLIWTHHHVTNHLTSPNKLI